MQIFLSCVTHNNCFEMDALFIATDRQNLRSKWRNTPAIGGAILAWSTFLRGDANTATKDWNAGRDAEQGIRGHVRRNEFGGHVR